MTVQLLFFTFVGSILWIISIVFRRYYLLNKLKSFVKRQRADKEKQMLDDIEKKSAIKEMGSWKKKKKFDVEAKKIVAKSDILISHWEYEEARKLLISLLVDNEDNFDVNLRLWQIALKKTNYSQAEIFFTKCLLTNKKDANVFSDLWYCFFKNWKYPDAIESYQYAIKLDPLKSWRFTNLWRVYFVINDYQKAGNALLKALKLNSRDTEVLFMLAENYIEMKKLEKAKEIYERILEIEPYNHEASDYISKLESRWI